VSPAWLNVIPAGRDLRPPSIADIGKPGALISGKPGLIGQLYELQNPATGSDEIFVLQAGGLMPVSRSVAAMLLTNPAMKGAYPESSVRPIVVGPGDVAGVQVMGNDPVSVDLPPTPPALADLGASGEPCMRFDPGSDAGDRPALVILPDSAEGDAVPPAGKHTVGTTADQVVIPVGGGALVRTVSTPGALPGTGFLVTDLGVKYPLVDDSVASILGYGHLTAVGVPVALLALLPGGPALGTGDALVSRPISPPGS
jgi:hypothetical protein